MGPTTQAARQRVNAPGPARGVTLMRCTPYKPAVVMASASITVRTTKTGRRFVVRYRLGGRAYPVEHGGSFPTMREAKIRRDLVAGELAAGRNPRILLDDAQTAPTAVTTFSAIAAEYQATRVDLAAETDEESRLRT